MSYFAVTVSLLANPNVIPLVKGQLSNQGLVGYWKFDKGSGTVAIDASGNNNNGSIQNHPVWVNGKSGLALSFNGFDSYVELPSNFIRSLSSVTISVWFKTTSYGVIIGDEDTEYPNNPTNTVPIIYIGTDGKLRGELWVGYVSPITSERAVNDGSWHNVVLVGDIDTQSLYLDGSIVGTLSGAINNLNMNINYVGTICWGSYDRGSWPASSGIWGFFNGVMDELQVYDLALAPNQFPYALNSSIANPKYDLKGIWQWNDIWLGVKYTHTVTISTFNTDGTFSGTGYNNNGPEKEDITGQIIGDTITFRWVTTSDVSNGVTLDGTGKVFSSSFMNGTGIQSDGYGSILWDATRIQNQLSTNTPFSSNQPIPSLTSSITTPPSSIPYNYSIIIVFLGLFLTVMAGVVIWRKIVTSRNGKENAKPLNGYTQQGQTFQEKEKEKAEHEREEQERQRAERERAEQQWRNEQQRRERAEQSEREQQRQREQRAQQDTQWNNSIDPYGILDVPRIAPQGEVKDRWRKLTKLYHPDRCKDKDPITQELYARKFDEINKAWEEIRKARGWN